MKVLSIQHPIRRAFTLLELLIVVAIIGVMMTLSIVVMMGFLDQAEEEATNATIQKVNKILEQKIEAFERTFIGARRSAVVAYVGGRLADPNLDGNRNDGIFGVKEAVVEILAKKVRYRFEFPQTMAERFLFEDAVGNTLANVPESMYRLVLAPNARAKLGLPETTSLFDPAIQAEVTAKLANHDPLTESSEMLYFALMQAGGLGSGFVDSDRFTDAEVRDTDDDGLLEFVDAWENPLRFYRWPTRLIDVNPPVPFQPVLSNPSDPTDVAVDLDGNGTIDLGVRQITADERTIANMLLKGLPPAPSILPNNAMPRDMLLIDPDDPVGRLYAELEHLDGTNGKPLLAVFYNEVNFHTPDTFHAPLVVSAGIDGRLGLFEPNDPNPANFGNLAAYDTTLGLDQVLEDLGDNITSRNKLSGGRQ